MGVFTSCAVWPLYSTILWKRQNKPAIVASPILGSITAIASWLGSAHALHGTVTVATTSQTIPLVIGNATSLVSGAVYSIALTYLLGADAFDWSRLQTDIRVVDDSDIKGLTRAQLAEQTAHEHLTPEAERNLKRGKRTAIIVACVLCAVFVIVWPIPMYGTGYVFSKPFFRFWVALTFLWAFGAAGVITVMPLVEGRGAVVRFFSTMVVGGKGNVLDGQAVKAEEVEDGGGEKKAMAAESAVGV